MAPMTAFTMNAIVRLQLWPLRLLAAASPMVHCVARDTGPPRRRIAGRAAVAHYDRHDCKRLLLLLLPLLWSASPQLMAAAAVERRLSTIIGADQILVLKNGVIAERGTHADLLAQQGAL